MNKKKITVNSARVTFHTSTQRANVMPFPVDFMELHGTSFRKKRNSDQWGETANFLIPFELCHETSHFPFKRQFSKSKMSQSVTTKDQYHLVLCLTTQ